MTPQQLLTGLLDQEFTTPLQTGVELLRRTIPHSEWRNEGLPAIFRQFPALPILWQQNHSAQFRYDKNGMYLSACSQPVGVGRVWHQSGSFPGYALSYPGLWRVNWGSNPIALPHEQPQMQEFIWTPMLRYFLKRDYQPEILEWWLFPQSKTLLRPFYEKVRIARQCLYWPSPLDNLSIEEAKYLLKTLYVSALGCLDHTSDNLDHLYRPDWYSMIIANANANLFYNILKVWQDTMYLPVSIAVDCVGYSQAAPFPIGRELGQYKLLKKEDDHARS